MWGIFNVLRFYISLECNDQHDTIVRYYTLLFMYKIDILWYSNRTPSFYKKIITTSRNKKTVITVSILDEWFEISWYSFDIFKKIENKNKIFKLHILYIVKIMLWAFIKAFLGFSFMYKNLNSKFQISYKNLHDGTYFIFTYRNKIWFVQEFNPFDI